MHSAANDAANHPGRFSAYRESLTATVTRTGATAVAVASIAIFTRLHRLPASGGEWFGWFVWVVAVGWISFGGHWAELLYLNGIRPRIANWSDSTLVCVRLVIWLVGGAILFLGAVLSRNLLMSGQVPGHAQLGWALRYGGPLFVAVELVVHLVLLLTGRPSFWNRRG